MSSDNGIYILKTKQAGEHATGFEYRVVHAQCIENLYYDIDTGLYRENFIPEEAFAYFKECQTFFEEALALRYAHHLADQAAILEYGVVELRHEEQEFEEFDEDQMMVYNTGIDVRIQQYREHRDSDAEAKRKAAYIDFNEIDGFQPTQIVGFITGPDGKRIYGRIDGDMSAVAIARPVEEPLNFLPNDWDRRETIE
jgi:hypothetical protein